MARKAKKSTKSRKSSKTRKSSKKRVKAVASRRATAKRSTRKRSSKKRATAKRAKAKTAVRAKRKTSARGKAAKRARGDVKGEGNYTASRKFLSEQGDFVKRNRKKIPAMGKEAEQALEGPEGNLLRQAEEDAKAHSHEGPEV